MPKSTILLTGASGTVGFVVLKQLVKKSDFNIIAFDKENDSSINKLAPFKDKIKLIYGNI